MYISVLGATIQRVALPGALLALSSCVLAAGTSRTPRTFDVIVRGGTVLDGTGIDRYRADVGIIGGGIAAIGDLSSDEGATELDARGLFVAPGFINIHSHASLGGLATAGNMLSQGATTEILNADGFGAGDIGPLLSSMDTMRIAINIGAYIGFNAVWETVMGLEDRRPSDQDFTRMKALISKGLELGAWGVSSGLEYTPASFARTEEVVEVIRPARQWRTNFPNHERVTAETNYSGRLGIAETIRISEAAGVVPVVTHVKAQGAEQGTAADLLAMIDQATRRGHYAAADVYPYLAGHGNLAALAIPRWAQGGGRAVMLQRFDNPEIRSRIVAEVDATLRARWGGPQGIYLQTKGQELVDAMQEMGVASAGEAIVRVVHERDERAFLRFGIESDLIRFMQHPATAIACDCGAMPPGVVAHPRAYGTFPRVLGRYVREQKALTWEDAVRKMTGLPASILGMVDRGFLAPGMAADVVVFDTATILDHATFETPGALSEGIRYVLVNGQVAVRDGNVTGARAGKVLRRSRHMPSRPIGTTGNRRVSVRGPVAFAETGVPGSSTNGEISLEVSQDAGGRRPSGHFRLTDRRSGRTLEADELGIVQMSAGWASLTGRLRRTDLDEERSFVAIVEQSDPFITGQAPSITLLVAGREPETTRLSPRQLRLVTPE